MTLDEENPYKRFATAGAREHEAPSKSFDVTHLRLELAIDEVEGAVEGSATLSLRPIVPTREVVLDAVDLDVRSVEADDKEVAFEVLPGSLRVELPRPAEKAFALRVSYRAKPRTGLHFIRPSKAHPRKPWQVWSQGQAEDSRHWFPVVDHPSDKMTSEVVATAKDRFLVVSNGRLVSTTHDKRARTRTWHWLHKVPHPAYLVCVVAGEFDEVRAAAGDVPLRYLARKGEGRRAEVLCRNTPDILAFFGEYTGRAYPYEKYDQAVLVDFMWGGMENTGITTLNERYLCDERHRVDVDPDGLVAHEAAHQWFGDLLTCKSWEHAWLNEGFATYFDALWHEHAFGADELGVRMRENLRAYLEEDAGKYRRAIATNVFVDAEDVFDRHLYPKAAWVLHTLRGVLGDEAFRASVRHYVRSHEGGNVETNDLRAAIEEATGRNLDGFFRQWIHKAGHPELEVSWKYEPERKVVALTVRQVQKVTQTDPQTPLFRFSADVLVFAGTPQRERVEITDREHVFLLPASRRPEFVEFDPDGRVLHVQKGERPRDERIAVLSKGPTAWVRMTAAEKLGDFPGDEKATHALESALAGDPCWGVRAAAAKALCSMATPDALRALRAAFADKDPRVRRAAAGGLGSFRTPEGFRQAARVATSDASDYVVASALSSAGATRQPAAFELLRSSLPRRGHNHVITAGALLGLGQTRERRAVALARRHAAPGRETVVRAAAITALANLWEHVEAERAAILESLVELARDPMHQVRRAAVEVLGRVDDAAAAAELRRAARAEVIGLVRAAARNASREHAERADRKADRARVRRDLEELRDEVRALKARVNELAGRQALSHERAAKDDGSPRTRRRRARAKPSR
ncbi:MAG TPA: M1 family aminopeptidase [Candidatus Thermoplasmatota archaeon]|nr:M1 family aminopeptidase [Candidatus Thermoplasmatota archaeon]